MRGKEVISKIGWGILWLFLLFGLLLQLKFYVSGEVTLLETLFNLSGFVGALALFSKEVGYLQYPVASFIGQLIGLAVMGCIIGVILQKTKQLKQWRGFTLGFALGYLGFFIALCIPVNRRIRKR